MSKELLGKYIKQVDVRAKNSNIEFTLDDISGISSIYKEFQNTKANLVDVTTDSYKIVSYHQFAYNPNTARMGDKIPIALNKEKKDVLVSSIYPVFSVDEQKIVPEYLLMWFKRSEFDRYARFKSHGSAREIFDWDEMCNIELDIPSIDEQKRKVNQYNVINNRINILRKINDNLEAQSNNIYKNIIVNAKTQNLVYGKVSDLGIFERGKNLTSNQMRNGIYPVISAGIDPAGFHNEYNVKGASITISGSGVNAGFVSLHRSNIWASDCSFNNNSKYLYSLFVILKNNQEKITELQKGTAQPHVFPKEVNPFPIVFPSFNILNGLEKHFKLIHTVIDNNNNEIARLKNIQKLLLYIN